MDVRTDPIFAGIAGASLEGEEVDLGHGITLNHTYAHLLAPLMMAFAAPEEAGKPHPAPWSAVGNGSGFDIQIQLYVPADLEIPQWFDRLNTVWWITALLRLKTGWPLQTPVISDRAFADIPDDWRSAVALPVETSPRYSPTQIPCERIVNRLHIQWLCDVWFEAGNLMNTEPRFNEAFQAFDQASTIRLPSVALLMLWGALEHLFSPASHELKFRVSAYIAAFLEPYGPERQRLQRSIGKLYDARSRVAHGAGVDVGEAYDDTYQLLRRILEQMIMNRSIPSREDFNALIFGGDPADSK